MSEDNALEPEKPAELITARFITGAAGVVVLLAIAIVTVVLFESDTTLNWVKRSLGMKVEDPYVVVEDDKNQKVATPLPVDNAQDSRVPDASKDYRPKQRSSPFANEYVSPRDGKLMKLVPAGTFLFGDADIIDSEGVMVIDLDAYYIDETEVTIAEYRKFVEDGGYTNRDYWDPEYFVSLREKKIIGPMIFETNRVNEEFRVQVYEDFAELGENVAMFHVNWYEASAYAKWAGKRLPWEVEWEKAARGWQDGRSYVWGDQDSPRSLDERALEIFEYANVNPPTIKVPSRVKAYPMDVSPYGVYDMTGNVAEFCADAYENEVFPKFETQDSKFRVAGAAKKNHVIRGDSFMGYTYSAARRVSMRRYALADRGFANYGFRCVIDASAAH